MSFEQDTQAFASWTKETFLQVSPKFEIANLWNEGQGRGIIATDDIAEGETLFELSRNAIINVESATLSQLQDGKNKQILTHLGQWESLILCLAYELMLGEKSRWKHYLRVLPQEVTRFTTPMFWNEEELAYFKPSCILNRLGKEEAEKTYHKLVPEYCAKLGVPELADFLNMEKFHAVASLIMSYSFDVEHPEVAEEEEKEIEEEEEGKEEENKEEEENSDQAPELVSESEPEESDSESDPNSLLFDSYLKSMVPLADTLNANTTLVNATLHYDHDKLAMKATKPIKKGEQVYNTYGELPNSEILRKYGYIELPSSAAEFADVPLEVVTNYYKDKFGKDFADVKNIERLVDRVLELVSGSEYLDEAFPDDDGGIVLSRYEVYAKGELIAEFILLLLVFSTLMDSFKSDPKWFKKMARHMDKSDGDFEVFVNRVVAKCYQLLEDKSAVTQSFLSDLQEILKARLSQYSLPDSYEFPQSYSLDLSKKQLADIILRNEMLCLEGDFREGNPKFEVIEDDRFLKNVLKRKLEQQPRKKRRKN